MHSPTLLYSVMLLVGLMTGIMLVAWKSTQIPGMREWFLAFLSALLNILLFLKRELFPEAVFSPILHALLLSSGAATLIGTYRYLGRRDIPYRTILLGILTTLAGIALLGTYLHAPVLLYRLASAATGVFFILTGMTIWPAHLTRYRARLLFAVISFAHGLFMCGRIFLFTGNFSNPTLAQMSAHTAQIILIEQQIVTVLFGFGIMLLANEYITSQLKLLANLDSLTNLYNRRAYLKNLEQSISFSNRTGQALCVLVIDVDHFKRINDSHGHDAGDMVLKTIAKTIEHCLRTEDVMGRMGGEEFSICLPNTTLASALIVADRICKTVHSTAITLESTDITCSVSVGVATLRKLESPRDVLRRSDQAMYFAKANGRNRVEYAM